MTILSLYCFTFLLLSSYAQYSPIMVIQILHHGARGPLTNMFDESWGHMVGQLTSVGMRQDYLLGQALKLEYTDLLIPYSPSRIYIRSTDVKRAIMGAQVQLFSIFQGTGPEIPNEISEKIRLDTYNVSENIYNNLNSKTEALPFQSIFVPIHLVRADLDYDLKIGSKTCPNQKFWRMENLKDHPTWNKALITMGPTLAEVNETFPEIPSLMKKYKLSYWDIYFYLAETVLSNYYDGRRMPKDLDYEEFGKDIVFLYQLKTVIEYYGTKKQIQVLSFNLLYEILQVLENRIEKKSDMSFVIFSAHDLTLLGPLLAFGLVSPECLWNNYLSETTDPFCSFPEFASDMRFELYNPKGEEFYVKLLYNDNPYNLCSTDDYMCSITQLRSLIKEVTGNLIFKDYADMCGIEDLEEEVVEKEEDPDEDSLEYIIPILGLLDAILIITIILIYTNNAEVLLMLVRGKKSKRRKEEPLLNKSRDPEKNTEMPVIKIYSPKSSVSQSNP